MKVLYRDESKIGYLELRLNDEGKLEAKMELLIPVPLGVLELKGILNEEEIAANIKHSMVLLSQSGVHELKLQENKEEN